MQTCTTGMHALRYAPLPSYTRRPSPRDALWRSFTLCKLEAHLHPAACSVAQSLARSATHVTIDEGAVLNDPSRAAFIFHVKSISALAAEPKTLGGVVTAAFFGQAISHFPNLEGVLNPAHFSVSYVHFSKGFVMTMPTALGPAVPVIGSFTHIGLFRPFCPQKPLGL